MAVVLLNIFAEISIHCN